MAQPVTAPWSRPRLGAVAGLVGWFATAVGAIGLLRVAGNLSGGALAAPPVTSVAALRGWIAARPPDAIVVALLRLVALGLAWYLAAGAALGLVAGIGRLGPLLSVTDRVALPPLRRLARAAAGIGLAAASLSLAPPLSVAWADPSSPPPTLRWLGASPPPAVGHPPSPAVGHPPSPAVGHPPSPAVGRPPSPAATATTPSPTPAGLWTVRSGDDFWRIAERTLQAAGWESPTDLQVARYWRQLIGLNAGRLVEAGDADLIYPGQVFMLPAPPAQ